MILIFWMSVLIGFILFMSLCFWVFVICIDKEYRAKVFCRGACLFKKIKHIFSKKPKESPLTNLDFILEDLKRGKTLIIFDQYQECYRFISWCNRFGMRTYSKTKLLYKIKDGELIFWEKTPYYPAILEDDVLGKYTSQFKFKNEEEAKEFFKKRPEKYVCLCKDDNLIEWREL